MSTVLQALRELEGKIAPADVAAYTAEDRRWIRWAAVGVVTAVIVIATIVGVALFSRRPAPPLAAPVAAPRAVPPPAAVMPAPPAPPVARGAPKLPTPVPVRKPAPPPPAAAPAAVPPTPAVPHRAEPPRSGTEPRIQIAGIRYSDAPTERTVMLAIDGDPPLTLHQGESTGDLEVQLILPDAIYVQRGGRVWMVSAR